MKLGLLQCDHVRPGLIEIAGDYQDMFRAMFHLYAPQVELVVYDVTADEWPATDACDAFLTTGSSASVYDSLPWIAELERFVRRLYRKRRIFVGICFGHQMIAQALGGSVSKSAHGWGIGAKEAQLLKRRDWMVPSAERLRLLVSHQDQIDKLPPGATTLASTVHCPHSILTVGETFLSFQGHPEFTPNYARTLALSRADRIPARVLDRAQPTFSLPLDSATVTHWIVRFVEDKLGSASAH